ncbi:MAG: hypothetical protein V7723_07485 [Sneathiella sp.]|uniref:hypothetical protein n=1 Tax=Sneathiella sp. TaxID=1964365 RepID=UPI0030036813
MIEIMTRAETAGYLRVSTRQLDRLGLPRHYVGKSPRFFKADALEYLNSTRELPNRVDLSPRLPSTTKRRRNAKLTTKSSDSLQSDIKSLLTGN